MFWRNNKYKNRKPTMSDAELTCLLQEWQGLTPPFDFQSGVRRRIASIPDSDSAQPYEFGWLFEKSRLKPARNVLAAAAAGIVIGVGAVFFLSASGPSVAGPDIGSQLSPSRSLTRAYTEMVTGGW